MKKFKFRYLLIILIIFFSLVCLYQNYIYYLIPYNPLVKLDANSLEYCDFTLHYSNGRKIESELNYNLNNNTHIFKYFRDLNLIPLKKDVHRDEIFDHENDTRFSYYFRFGSPTYDFLIIDEIWLDDLSILCIRIRNGNRHFCNGYYKIIDSKFDYKYVNSFFTNSQN